MSLAFLLSVVSADFLPTASLALLLCSVFFLAFLLTSGVVAGKSCTTGLPFSLIALVGAEVWLLALVCLGAGILTVGLLSVSFVASEV